MAGYTTGFINDITDFITGDINVLSLHFDDPGSTGANEVSGGGYSRQTPSYPAATGGQTDLSSSLTYSVDAGTTVKYWGAWDASNNFLLGRPMQNTASGGTTFSTDGTFELTSAPIDPNNP